MTKRFGFTLAEVLITLGIIGVVAAMTIPNLIANTNGAKFRSQFKKTISTLSQAGLMAQAQYDFDYASTTETCSATVEDAKTENPEATMTFCSILNGTLTGQSYMGPVSNIKRNVNGASVEYKVTWSNGVQGDDKGEGDYKNYLAYSLADGSIIAFDPNAKGCEVPIGTVINNAALTADGDNEVAADGVVTLKLKQCLGFIDVNGTTLPNKEVTCSKAGGGTGSADNAATLNPDFPCTVKNDAKHMTDVFPVVFHDASVEAASDAAKYVLTSSK